MSAEDGRNICCHRLFRRFDNQVFLVATARLDPHFEGVAGQAALRVSYRLKGSRLGGHIGPLSQ